MASALLRSSELLAVEDAIGRGGAGGDGLDNPGRSVPPTVDASKRLRLPSRLFRKVDAAVDDDAEPEDAAPAAVVERIMDSMAVRYRAA